MARRRRPLGCVLGIVSIVLGLASCATVYCSLTSVGVAVLGVIAYAHPEVRRAFALRAQGVAAADIPDRLRGIDPGEF